ncbi:MAG TPA: nuclear transport factor 2 family protein [Actinomycetota bacterium]|nr:nuclear transport factor 2 family protein [Actinomycetota bacterium]
MGGEQNAEVVRKGFEAFGKGDMDTLRNEVFTEDTVWHVGGRSPIAGDYRGQEVFEWFGRLFQETGGTFKVELHDVATSDEHVVAMTSASGERGGKRLEDSKGVQVHHFQGGKISESWLTVQDPYENDEFWS